MPATRGRIRQKQIQQIANSIREFGFTNPVLIDADGGVIAGHGRIEAAKMLGIRAGADHPLGSDDRGAKARLHDRRQPAGRKRRLGPRTTGASSCSICRTWTSTST